MSKCKTVNIIKCH